MSDDNCFDLLDELFSVNRSISRGDRIQDLPVPVPIEQLEKWERWAEELIESRQSVQLDVANLYDENEVLKSKIAKLEKRLEEVEECGQILYLENQALMELVPDWYTQ